MTTRLPLCASIRTEERLVGWLMLGAVAFFLFAASVLPVAEQNRRHSDGSAATINASVHLKTKHHQELTRESLFNEIYRRTFTLLKDEKQQFLRAEEAKLMLPGHPDSKRKVHCGGWVSDIPSIVLKFMGTRCPPFDLI